MIEINLVPPEYRKRRKKGVLPVGVNIPSEVVIGSIGGVFAVLIVLHIGLLLLNVTKLAQRNSLKLKKETISPKKEKVDIVLEELKTLQDSYKNVQTITSGTNFSWARKLNILSDSLPRGVWLKRVALDADVFFIEGSAISKLSKEIINVHSYTSALKDSPDFLTDFEDLELGSISTRKVQKIEVADFLITTKLKKE